jgi:Holliday junction resolvase RusA-like endonuclease
MTTATATDVRTRPQARPLCIINIVGLPEPKGSMDAFAQPYGPACPACGERKRRPAYVTERRNSPSRKWQSRAHWAAKYAWERPALSRNTPVALEILFLLDRPKSVRRDEPTVKPDLDKLARGILDAFTGVVYEDDAQIVELRIRRRYAESNVDPAGRELEPPGAIVAVSIREE